MLLPAGRMNTKSKIRINKKIIEEVWRENDGAREFIDNKVKELCSQKGISTEEVRLHIFLNEKT